MTTAYRPSRARNVKPGNSIFFVQWGVGILTDVTTVEAYNDRDDCPVVRLSNRAGAQQVLPADDEVFIRY